MTEFLTQSLRESSATLQRKQERLWPELVKKGSPGGVQSLLENKYELLPAMRTKLWHTGSAEISALELREPISMSSKYYFYQSTTSWVHVNSTLTLLYTGMTVCFPPLLRCRIVVQNLFQSSGRHSPLSHRTLPTSWSLPRPALLHSTWPASTCLLKACLPESHFLLLATMELPMVMRLLSHQRGEISHP